MLLAVFVPTLGSFALPLLGRVSLALRNYTALALVAAALACCGALVGPAASGQTASVIVPLAKGLNLSLHLDGLAVFMALVSSLISTIIVIYSISYISHYEHQDEYYWMVVLFLGSMMGLVFSGNLVVLYVFWELTAITSWRLIGFYRNKQDVVRADKAFLMTGFGALAMLLGFIILYTQTGTFELAGIRAALGGAPIGGLAAGLILLGILSKSATLPLHSWLPDAGVAPSPVTALLHAAVLVKIGVYVYARLFLATMVLDADWHTVVLVVAAASALVSACAAMVDNDIKRIIAYSTVSQIAFIFLGLAAGNEMGAAGAMVYILMHGLAKGGLFLCAGIIEQNTHTKDIRRMGGLIRTMPVTAVSFMLCSLSIMGVPPMGGFFGKYMVLSAAAGGGHLGIAMVFLAGAVLTIVYLLRLFAKIFMGDPAGEPAKEGSPSMVACVAVLAGLALVAGVWINPSAQFARSAAQQMAAGMGHLQGLVR